MTSPNTVTYEVLSDPGHAWMRVNKSEIKELGVQDKISEYSYQLKNTVYLEEDCDMGIFLNALRTKFPHVKVNFKEVIQNEPSGIRNWPPYRSDL